jgi:hypothetical protein
MKLRSVGIFLTITAASACAILHVSTFVTITPGLSILVPFILLAGAILCARQIQPWRYQSSTDRIRFVTPKDKTAIVGWVLLAYALILLTCPVFLNQHSLFMGDDARSTQYTNYKLR